MKDFKICRREWENKKKYFKLTIHKKNLIQKKRNIDTKLKIKYYNINNHY